MDNGLWLVICGAGPDAGVFRIKDGRYVIGRAASCEIRLVDSLVSRRHAMLEKHEEKLSIEDLASRNGTFVDGKRVRMSGIAAGSSLSVGHVALHVQSHLADRPRSIDDEEATDPASVGEPADVLFRAKQLPPYLTRVLVLLVDGYAEKRIAPQLGLTPRTVHSYVKEIYKSLGVQSRAQLCAVFRNTETMLMEQPEAAVHFPTVTHARPSQSPQSFSNVW